MTAENNVKPYRVLLILSDPLNSLLASEIRAPFENREIIIQPCNPSEVRTALKERWDLSTSDSLIALCETPELSLLSDTKRSAPFLILPGNLAREPGQMAFLPIIMEIAKRFNGADLEENLLRLSQIESFERLVHTASHQFKNILCVIQAHAFLCNSKELPEELQDSINSISQATGRAMDLLGSILKMCEQYTNRAVPTLPLETELSESQS